MMLRQWFEVRWVKATPMTGAVATNTSQEVAAAATQNLLRLLATGRTDEAVGRLLGVSPRTIRRRVSELETAAGATNRCRLNKDREESVL